MFAVDPGTVKHAALDGAPLPEGSPGMNNDPPVEDREFVVNVWEKRVVPVDVAEVAVGEATVTTPTVAVIRVTARALRFTKPR